MQMIKHNCSLHYHYLWNKIDSRFEQMCFSSLFIMQMICYQASVNNNINLSTQRKPIAEKKELVYTKVRK